MELLEDNPVNSVSIAAVEKVIKYISLANKLQHKYYAGRYSSDAHIKLLVSEKIQKHAHKILYINCNAERSRTKCSGMYCRI